MTAISSRAVRHQQSREDRLLVYRDFRRSLGVPPYTQDIDQFEYRFIGDQVRPVAILELTRIDGTQSLPQTCLDLILQRIQHGTAQGRVLQHVASRCGAPAYLVAFRENCRDFWIYNLSTQDGWYQLDQRKYRSWIAQL